MSLYIKTYREYLFTACKWQVRGYFTFLKAAFQTTKMTLLKEKRILYIVHCHQKYTHCAVLSALYIVT